MYEKPYHQSYNTSSSLLLKTRSFESTRSYLHYHQTFELVYAIKGDIVLVLRNKRFTVKEGQCIFLLPYQIHDYIGGPGTRSWIANFSPNLVKHFQKNFSDRHSASPVFTPSTEAMALIKRCIIDGFPAPQNVSLMTVEQECSVKSALYLVCSEYIKNAVSLESVDDTETLAFKVLEYISENFRDYISLQSAAASLGYSYHYLSKVFNKAFGYSFKTMLNHYRSAYAEQLLKESDLPITSICFESGFQSQRAFNQVFEETYGMPPSKMRKRYGEKGDR